jgi:cytochrome c-type biogenesis protein CcmE
MTLKPRHKRAAMIAGGLTALGLAAYLVLNAFESNLVFFFTPTQVASGEAPINRTFRIGGMVKMGTIKRDNLTVKFIVTDTSKDVEVAYTGILPDLFREGKGVVAQGKLGADGAFIASEVLAKHDENYMPPDAQHAMDQAKAQQSIKTLK